MKLNFVLMVVQMQHKIVEEICEKYEEYFEMMDTNQFQVTLIEILASLLVKERDNNKHMQKRLRHYENNRC